MTPLLMSVPEAAAYLGRSAWWLRARISEGEVPARRVGVRFFVSRLDLDRWLSGGESRAAGSALGAPSPKGARRGD